MGILEKWQESGLLDSLTNSLDNNYSKIKLCNLFESAAIYMLDIIKNNKEAEELPKECQSLIFPLIRRLFDGGVDFNIIDIIKEFVEFYKKFDISDICGATYTTIDAEAELVAKFCENKMNEQKTK